MFIYKEVIQFTFISSSVSGDLSIQSAICPDSINLDTTSGNMKIEIPENNGFTLHFSSVSGDLKNDFPVTSSSGDYSIYKNGGSDIKMNSVSGDGNIIKS